PTADLTQLTLYVFLWPLYVVPLTVLLIFLYYLQDRRYRLQAALEQCSRSETVIHLIKTFSEYEARAKENPALGDFGTGTLRHVQALIEGLIQGRITKS